MPTPLSLESRNQNPRHDSVTKFKKSSVTFTNIFKFTPLGVSISHIPSFPLSTAYRFNVCQPIGNLDL
jgi:hypothetical protein